MLKKINISTKDDYYLITLYHYLEIHLITIIDLSNKNELGQVNTDNLYNINCIGFVLYIPNWCTSII